MEAMRIGSRDARGGQATPAGEAGRFAPVAQLDRAADFGSAGWGFESSQARLVGPLAQLVEQLTLNQRVGGSSPSRLTLNAGVAQR